MFILKICSVCKIEKNKSDFAKQKLGKEGLRSYCKVCSNIYSSKYHTKNKEYILSYKRKYQIEHYRKNKEQYYNRNANRRSLLSKDTWDKELTLFVFEEAKSLCKLRETFLGFKWHVDHIIPLKHKDVCGLHVWNNLQLLPAKLNHQKNNRLEL